MSKPTILFQLDPDRHASSFDAAVAIDSGVEHLVPYGAVNPDDVEGLAYDGAYAAEHRAEAVAALATVPGARVRTDVLDALDGVARDARDLDTRRAAVTALGRIGGSAAAGGQPAPWLVHRPAQPQHPASGGGRGRIYLRQRLGE